MSKVLTKFDEDYNELCEKILNEGVEVENRTGINTIKIPSYELSFDLSKEFPILTTKQLFYRQAVIEILWIWQMKSNDVRELQKRGVHIWDKWMIDDDGIYRIYEPYGEYDPDKIVKVIDPLSVPIDDPFGLYHDFKYKRNIIGKIKTAKSLIPGQTIKAAKWYGKKRAGTIGDAYGFNHDRYDYVDSLIYRAKNTPNDRRIVISTWQDEFLRTSVLPPCVWATEWDITDGKLNLLVHQRSCDVPLGLPFNVTQYAVLLMMIAQVTGLKPGIIKYSIKDAHIYVNQIDGIKEQIRRVKEIKELESLERSELAKLKEEVQTRLDKIEDKKSNEYKVYDTKLRQIDMVLEPSTPIMQLNPEIDNFYDFDNSANLKDLKLLKYKHMGKIEFPLAQ